MREIFEDIQSWESLDPSEAARRNMQVRGRRFYLDAQVFEEGAGTVITLDGRAVRTPARNKLSAPSTALAEAIAAEWRRQGEFIDPATMPLTRLANTIIDGVAHAPDEVAGEVAKYLRSDLLCYRAMNPQGLVAREAAHWDPIVLWAHDVLGARFVVGRGVVHVIQPDDAIAAASAAIPRASWRLGAVHSIATLTGSALLALAVARGRITAEAAWTAGHVDEDWNMELWGRDELALKRRDYRLGEMAAAANVLATVREGSGPRAR